MDYEVLLEFIKDIKQRINDLEASLNKLYGDKTSLNEQAITDTQDGLCEASTDTEERLAEIEDAICELSEE